MHIVHETIVNYKETHLNPSNQIKMAENLAPATMKSVALSKESSSLKTHFRSPLNCTTHKTTENGVKDVCKPRGCMVSKLASEKKVNQTLTIEERIVYNQTNRMLTDYKKNISQLKNANRILKRRINGEEKDISELIAKWRQICQGAMSYLLNSTLFKIDRMGGFEELVRREIEAEKAMIEDQVDSELQGEIEDIEDSEEFRSLPEDSKAEYKQRIEEKTTEMEVWKQKRFIALDEKLKGLAGREMDMEELSRRLKVDYSLVFLKE